MAVVDLRGEDAAVVGTVELQQGHRDRLGQAARRLEHAGAQHLPVVLEGRGHARPQVLVQLRLERWIEQEAGRPLAPEAVDELHNRAGSHDPN
jgi:methylmalonyl-CoA mutase cobalamin-binding subunit